MIDSAVRTTVQECCPLLAARRLRRLGLAASATLCCVVAAGCVSPQRAVRDANATAYGIIEEKQQAALGRTEEFTLESPEDELRRRLMLDQQLPGAGPASFGKAFLPPVPEQPEGVSAGIPLPESAVMVGATQPTVEGVRTPTLATDLFLVDIGRNPESGAVESGVDPNPALVLGPPVLERAPLVLEITLADALVIGARNSRGYQSQKESVFLSALELDLERDRFEFRFGGFIDAGIQSDLGGDEADDVTGLVVSPGLNATKLFKNGMSMTTRIGIDLARLLSGDKSSAFGTFADATINIPLLRGAGVEVVTEPLQQAERETIYAIWEFERFKGEFAINVFSQYLRILSSYDQAENALSAYDLLRENVARSRALYEEGRIPGIDVDQLASEELRARERVLLAIQRYESALDSFKVFLGLPPDARVVLDADELQALTPVAERVLGSAPPGATDSDLATTQDATDQVDIEQQLSPQGPAAPVPPSTRPSTQPATLPEPVEVDQLPGDVPEISPIQTLTEADQIAIRTALKYRLDLAVQFARVADAQRATVVAADGLKADFDLNASAAYGGGLGALSGGADDTSLRLDGGTYGAGASFNLPIERTAERNSYRISLINLDRAIRAAQEQEDGVKLDILNALRDLRVAAEDLKIQSYSIATAQRRVDAAELFLDLGQGEARDLTEAVTALNEAKDSFTSSLIDYRVAELSLQRDLGLLQVGGDGIFVETADLIGLMGTQPGAP